MTAIYGGVTFGPTLRPTQQCYCVMICPFSLVRFEPPARAAPYLHRKRCLSRFGFGDTYLANHSIPPFHVASATARTRLDRSNGAEGGHCRKIFRYRTNECPKSDPPGTLDAVIGSTSNNVEAQGAEVRYTSGSCNDAVHPSCDSPNISRRLALGASNACLVSENPTCSVPA